VGQVLGKDEACDTHLLFNVFGIVYLGFGKCGRVEGDILGR